ncbi:MAG: hypothetical protein LBC85_09380 [Fibromonadaceae bacterium]|jgi:hypothetical protein|nr:hypothetical protein [Fibromonadaceae bacterium]
MPLLLAFIFCLLACAKPQKSEPVPVSLGSLEKISCPADFIRGVGVDESEQAALAQARTAISSQIRLSITAASEYSKRLFANQSVEIIERTYNTQVKETTELLNAQAVRVQAVKKSGGRVGVVACMSREDAAKPYLSRLPQLNDSLNTAIQTVLAQEHPLRKKAAAQKMESLRIQQIMAVQVLQGLGKSIELPNNAYYEQMVKNYQEFISNYKFIWEGGDEEVSQVLVSKISSRYKIETGTCIHGLKLVPVSVETFCENSRFGPQCSYLPNLEGRSCNDELYFTLKGQIVRGTGLRDEVDAMRKLLALIPNAPFWNIWFAELDEWR